MKLKDQPSEADLPVSSAVRLLWDLGLDFTWAYRLPEPWIQRLVLDPGCFQDTPFMANLEMAYHVMGYEKYDIAVAVAKHHSRQEKA